MIKIKRTLRIQVIIGKSGLKNKQCKSKVKIYIYLPLHLFLMVGKKDLKVHVNHDIII